MRVFALEYIRKMIHANELHFVSAKKKVQFEIKAQIGPFICNSRAAGEVTEKIFKGMGFSHSFTWSYYPARIISKKRVEKKSTPYIHTHKYEIEQFMNEAEWIANKLQEAEE